MVKCCLPCNLSPFCFSSSCLLLAMWLTTASWTWSATALSGCTVSWGRRACTRVRSSNVPLTLSPLPGTQWSPMLSCWRWWSRSSTSFLCCRWALAAVKRVSALCQTSTWPLGTNIMKDTTCTLRCTCAYSIQWTSLSDAQRNFVTCLTHLTKTTFFF